MLDTVLILIIIVAGFKVKNFFKSQLNSNDFKTLNYLWLYHIIFGIAYWAYISFVDGGDATFYYEFARELSFEEKLLLFFDKGAGTIGMLLMVSYPAKILSFLGASLLFTLIGYIGIVFFYVLFVTNIKFNSRIFKFNLFPLLFFLPNLHFWSAGLGKDTFSFFCIGMFIYGMQKPEKHVIKITLALILAYLVRPHIAVFLVASFAIAFMLEGNLKLYQKIIIGFIFLGAFVVLFEKFMGFIEMDSLDMENIEDYSSSKAASLSKDTTGSSVDISSYPYPLKVFTFMYRPLFFDINNALAVVASFENLLLLLLSFKFILLNPIKLFIKGNHIFKGMFIFLLAGALTFSLILGNLGIMLREKNMFTPSLLFIVLWGLSYQMQSKLKKNNSLYSGKT